MQDDGTLIGAAFKVIGDFKDAWSSAFRLRDSQFKVLEIATRLMTSKKRRAQRPFEFVFVLSDCCSLLQAIKTKKPNRVSCDADEITIYSKNEESCSLPRSFLPRSFRRFPLCFCFTGCRMGGRRAGCGNQQRSFHAPLSVRETELFWPHFKFVLCLSFSFQDRLLWLHIAISVLFSAALRLAFHLSCPSVAEVKST